MNKFKQIYCRAFQTVFKYAIPVMPYREPKTINGIGETVMLLRRKKIRRILLVTDPSIRGLGLTAKLEKYLKKAKIKATVYDEVQPNPTIANVEVAKTLYLADRCQAIIAVGGGSVMDCAKGAGARVARPHLQIPKMRGILKILLPTPLTIAIPTTAGTGSEATLAAVITDPDKKYKYPINDFPLIPNYAVFAPELTEGLPKFITATTGMDALTHAVEAYIGRSTTKLTRAMSEEAVTLIYQNLYEAYQHPHNLQARSNMLRAAYCAGVSFTRSYVGYVHGIAHSLGGQYGTAHGLANAVILPYFLEEYGESVYGSLAKLARISNMVPEETGDREAAEKFIAWVKEMNAKMEIPTKIPEIREEDIPVMAQHADVESNPLYPVPVLMDAKELEKMYRRLMPEKEN